MSMAYDFVAPQRIVFGWGRRREVGVLGRTLGRRALLVCGSRTLIQQGMIDQIRDLLHDEGVKTVATEPISREPQVEDVDCLAAELRRQPITADDFILAIGGGAAMDLAKAVAAMVTNPESPTVKDYLENVGRNLKIVHAPLSVLAMPTTAGTGTEATKNAVISSHDPPFKKSLRDVRIVPRIALVDPELTVTCPPQITAATGMDAITQLLESYISRKAQPIPRALAVEGLCLAVPAIVDAVHNGTLRGPREHMAHAALLSGLCLANSGLGMAHGVAPALGVHCRVPHGVACAVMLTAALRVNRLVCQDDLARLARHILDTAPEDPEQAVGALSARIDTLCDELGLPRRLSALGVRAEQIPDIVASSRGSSMSGNPVDVSDGHLSEVLEEIF